MKAYCLLFIAIIAALVITLSLKQNTCLKYGELNKKVVEPYGVSCFIKTDKGWYWK